MDDFSDMVANSRFENDVVQSTLERLGLEVIPPHPVQGEKGKITIHFKMLTCDAAQLDTIKNIYARNQHFHKIFTELESSQNVAREHLRQQNLLIDDLGDLGNGWSRRWSSVSRESAEGYIWQRILFQCQSGSSTTARKLKADRKKLEQGRSSTSDEWKRKMPYDYTGCLAHLDLTYDPRNTRIYRITGILEHNDTCKSQLMSRLPAVPVRPHVWQDALEQINNGANMTAVQKRNQELFQAKLYHGQREFDSSKANYRYILLTGDSRTLYRRQAKFFGVDLQKPPAENVDNWLNCESKLYRLELALAAPFYKGRTNKHERFILCIQTAEMKMATWEYSHNKQLIIYGTFGICDRRILLFIALGVDRQNRGIPLAFFLFSAPTLGNRATHAGYDTNVLTGLLKSWANSLGKREDQVFAPKIVITDTDTRERGAILSVWPHTTLLLCKFHTRQCWTNKRKLLVKGSESQTFYKDQVIRRLQNLEKVLIDSEIYTDAVASVNSEKAWLSDLQRSHPHLSTITTGAISYVDYLSSFWLSQSLWESWSAFGRITASQILGIPLDGVIPTTNHLEAFNGVLKHKYIHQYQKNGRRIRFDLLIMLLITKILPGIYIQRSIEREYYDWLSARFGSQLQTQEPIEARKSKKTMNSDNPTPRREYAVTWWSPNSQVHYNASAQAIIAHHRISDFKWIDSQTVEATCASSLSNTTSQNHTRYAMSLNCYGLAACSCPFNSNGNGACKHLWAFRYILPTLSPTVSFYFPLTEKAALDIRQLFFPSSHAASTSNQTPRIPDVLPEPPKNHLCSVATIANVLSSMVPDSDASSGSELEEFDIDEDFTDTSDTELAPQSPSASLRLASGNALQEQLKARITQEVASILPRLHGLSQLLNDGQDNIGGIPEVSELKSIVDTLHATLSNKTALADNSTACVPSTTPPSTSMAPNPHKQFHKTSQRPRVLPPSPERNQKRKRSTATY